MDFSLASHALAHGKVPKPPAKKLASMTIKKAKGGYIVTHHHLEHEPQDHVVANTDALHNHIEQHYGEANDGEAEALEQAKTMDAHRA